MTVEKLCWVVGLHLGTMFEDNDLWSKKIMGRERSARVHEARAIVMLALHEHIGVSLSELSRLFANRDIAGISRCIGRARRWRDLSKNTPVWDVIVESITKTIDSEREHHQSAAGIKIGGSST